MAKLLLTLSAVALLLTGCPSTDPEVCTVGAGQCPNVCTSGTGVTGEACNGPDDCGCGLACIGGACTPYTGANAGCSCEGGDKPDAGGETTATEPWDENCAAKVDGAQCNPYCQAGCDAVDRHCAFSASNFECRAFGSAGIGQECADSAACAEGLSCFRVGEETVNTCRKPCISATDCPDNRPCNQTVDFPEFSATFCGESVVSCELFGTDSCGSGEGCYLSNQAPTCLSAGTAAAGTDCSGQPANLCAAGLQCVVECQQVCSTDAASSAAPSCADLCAGAEVLEIDATYKFGVCLSATIPAVCDPWSQTGCGAGEGCYLVNGGFGCIGAGATPAGSPCQFTNDCAAGTVCAGGLCQTLCSNADGAPATQACASVCTTSNPLTPTAWQLGVCTSM